MKKNLKVELIQIMEGDRFFYFNFQEAIQILFAPLPSTREALESELMEASVLLLTRLGGQVEEFP